MSTPLQVHRYFSDYQRAKGEAARLLLHTRSMFGARLVTGSTEAKTRKKLLYIITLAELGGAQKYVRDLSGALKSDYEITIASNAENETLLSWASKAGLRTFPLSYLERELALGFLPTLNDFKTFLSLLKHIRAERYDIVHLNSSKMGLIGGIAARLTDTSKIVFTAHGWVFNEPKSIRPKRWLWIWISRLAAKFQDHIICVSEYDFDQALCYKIAPPRKLFTIRNGLDVNKIAFLPRAKPRAELEKIVGGFKETIIAGTIANHYPTKDLGTMIEAIARVKNKNVKLVIIGEGPEREALKLKVISYKLQDRVFLTGRIENAAQYLKAFDIYLISSLKEGLPYSALEAMAAGVPIISTGVGGLHELFLGAAEKPAALIFAPGDSIQLAKHIEALIENHETAAKLGRYAKERVAKLFSLEEMLEKTRWIYDFE